MNKCDVCGSETNELPGNYGGETGIACYKKEFWNDSENHYGRSCGIELERRNYQRYLDKLKKDKEDIIDDEWRIREKDRAPCCYFGNKTWFYVFEERGYGEPHWGVTLPGSDYGAAFPRFSGCCTDKEQGLLMAKACVKIWNNSHELSMFKAE